MSLSKVLIVAGLMGALVGSYIGTTMGKLAALAALVVVFIGWQLRDPG